MKMHETESNLGLSIGIAVRRYRELARLTQASLAEKANVVQAEISHIEQGKRTCLKTLDRVARALDRRLSDMIRFAEDIPDTATVVREARAFAKRVKGGSGSRGTEKMPAKRTPRATAVR